MACPTDGLGSVTALSNMNGQIAERYVYDAFGNTQILDAGLSVLSASAVGNSILFTGRRLDVESALYDYRARIVSPDLGRFLQPDPLGYIDGLNLYAYVSNNPLNWIDPWGLFHFGSRPLSDGTFYWIHGLSKNFSYDWVNLEISHEHGFYDDAEGGNVGYGPEGVFTEDPQGKNYRYDNKYYDDEIMRQAVENVNNSGKFSPENYSVILKSKKKHNCQDYCTAIRREYKRLGGKVYKNKEEYLKAKKKNKKS